jgi:hypothetical protein
MELTTLKIVLYQNQSTVTMQKPNVHKNVLNTNEIAASLLHSLRSSNSIKPESTLSHFNNEVSLLN